jgi:hypothetical protein
MGEGERVRELVSAEVSPTTDTTSEKKQREQIEVKGAFVSEGGVRGSNLETSPVRSGDRLGLGLLLLGLSCSSWRLRMRRKCGWGQRWVSPAWQKVDVTKKKKKKNPPQLKFLVLCAGGRVQAEAAAPPKAERVGTRR